IFVMRSSGRPPPPDATLFPYTTLFRSVQAEIGSLRRQHGRKSLPCRQLRAAIRLNLSVRPQMRAIFCPGCNQHTQAKVWDFIPWLGGTRKRFWCRACHQWFAFSDGAMRAAFWASIAAILLPILAVRLSFELSGAR